MSEDRTLISIVDDDTLARDGIKALVESLGYEARIFSSAEHFLESGVGAETACLITDHARVKRSRIAGGAAIARMLLPNSFDYRLSQ
jgi:FixJ family two-component response regulator